MAECGKLEVRSEMQDESVFLSAICNPNSAIESPKSAFQNLKRSKIYEMAN